MTTKIGILKYIAGSAARGVKFEDQPETWFNPSNDEAKAMVKDSYKGKPVEINLTGKKHEFSSMIAVEEKIEKGETFDAEEPKVTEEIVADEETCDKHHEMVAHFPKGTKCHLCAEEEKVPLATPPKEEEEEVDAAPGIIPVAMDPEVQDRIIWGPRDIVSKDYDCTAFSKMNETKVKIEKKNKLNYASWAEVWKELKKIHPTSSYQVHENRNGMPYFYDEKLGAFVKVSVTVMGLTHTVHLPVMNNYNKAEKGALLDVMLINKNIQRAFAKAIAMHGMGLYVYNGEDLPEDTK